MGYWWKSEPLENDWDGCPADSWSSRGKKSTETGALESDVEEYGTDVMLGLSPTFAIS